MLMVSYRTLILNQIQAKHYKHKAVCFEDVKYVCRAPHDHLLSEPGALVAGNVPVRNRAVRNSPPHHFSHPVFCRVASSFG